MVRLEAVTKRYGSVTALAAADLSVAEGEFVTLLGPSGSGKTTLLNLVAGMISPTAGRIIIAGTDATEVPPERRGLGMVFQNYALLPHMTIFENVAFPLRVRRLPESEIRRKVGEVLEMVQLPHVARRRPRELSGGQQQRVALARAIVYNPSLILMDEPLGALDKNLREQMQVEIRKLHATLGITILYVTHDQEEALSMSDRIVLLNRARIVQVGTPAELYFSPRSVFAATFLGASNILDAQCSGDAPVMQARLATGEVIRLADPAQAGAGGALKLLVRPETLSLRVAGAEPEAAHENSVRATMRASAILGGVINHHVALSDGTALTVRELTRAGSHYPKPGEAVQISWNAREMVALPSHEEQEQP